MNEKIQALAEAAAEYAVLNPGDEELLSESDEHSIRIPREFIEEFSRLVIEECANLTLDHKSEADYYHGWLDYRDEIRRQLLT